MKNLKKSPKLLIFVSITIVLATILAVLIMNGNGNGLNKNDIQEITINQSGVQLTVNANGSVSLLTNDGLFTSSWSDAKTKAFFDYILDKYGTSLITGDGTDELIEAVITETLEGTGGGSGAGAGGGSGGGGAPGATVKPNPPTGIGGGPTATPQGPPPTGIGGGDPICLFWILTFCVTFPSPGPSPTPGSTEGIIEAPDCDSWKSQTDQSTVIDYTVCITE